MSIVTAGTFEDTVAALAEPEHTEPWLTANIRPAGSFGRADVGRDGTAGSMCSSEPSALRCSPSTSSPPGPKTRTSSGSVPGSACVAQPKHGS